MFLRKKKDEDIESDWRDLDALPREAVSKSELDTLQKEVVDELERLQADTIAQAGESSIAKPQTLFYYHKYIDTKFNKSDFDIDTYFSKKQNIVDRKYAEGLGDVEAEFTGYKELISEIHKVDQRLRRKVNKLDPNSQVDLDAPGTYDDSVELLNQINDIPKELDWNKYGEKMR